jgi:hypothetical protein
MIIVQVSDGRKIFLVRRGMARRRSKGDRGFRVVAPFVHGSGNQAPRRPQPPDGAARHRLFGTPGRDARKKASPHLGRTRTECL